MLDQAEALRALVRDKVVCVDTTGRMPRVHTVAVTSGKGGVGKTSIAVNLALLLAKSGRRVRLIDADLGLSNAEVMLGVSPGHNMQDVLEGRITANDAWHDAPGGIKIMSSGSGLEDLANMSGELGVGLIEY
jgi:flagellar biosynthesis protein FlhG